MRIAVLADEMMKEELLMQSAKEGTDILWVKSDKESLDQLNADAFIDLLFENKTERIEYLEKINARIVMINYVNGTLQEMPSNFIRINGWPTFLKRSVVEASCSTETLKKFAEEVFSNFNKTVEWVPDNAGFITARVVAMIINEAYFALEEKVSTKDEIDISMKLGTNYPMSPFEWSKEIGLINVYSLLSELTKTNSRYQPSLLLEKEARS